VRRRKQPGYGLAVRAGAPSRRDGDRPALARLTRRGAICVAATSLLVPAAAQANGDPASDYLLVEKVFFPFNAKVDSDAAAQLRKLLDAAAKARFPVRVAVIGARSDLGTAFSLFRKPQRYAEFLGLELSFLYPGRLLVVMPNGFGYAVNGEPDPMIEGVLKRVPPPGPGATSQVQAATLAVQRIAAAQGRKIEVPGDSATRDRIVIAAAATAGVAFLAALLLYRRRRQAPET
jgi:hypothetical protein